MEYGICNLAVIPLRAEPNERSEMVSQVLFGEAFEIIEWNNNWVRITTLIDNYSGWIGRLQFAMLGHIVFKELQQKPSQLTRNAITQAWKIIDNSVLYLPIGSSLSCATGTTCHIGDEKFEIIGSIGKDDDLDVAAISFLNVPYLWGGRTHFGIDCSGFTQVIFRLKGINLLRDAAQQAGQGWAVNSLAETQLGDLAFFHNDAGKIVHVGILLNPETIIHASGRVKVDRIDENGIYSVELKRYTHTLNSIKRHAL